VILYPQDWSYAKISVISKNTGKIDVTSITPKKDSAISVTEIGKYWILANIITDGEEFDAFETISVGTPSPKNNFDFLSFLGIPERPFIIVVVAVIIISLVGLKFRSNTKREPVQHF